MDDQNINSTFSGKSDIVLAEIMKKNNLEGRTVKLLLTKLTMFFSRDEISEKEVASSLQKEANISQEVADKITAEIKNRLIPTLWDRLPPEEKEKLLSQIPKMKESDDEETELPKTKPQPEIKKTFAEAPPQKRASPVTKKSEESDRYREAIE
jgi:hypothetical protein